MLFGCIHFVTGLIISIKYNSNVVLRAVWHVWLKSQVF